MLLLHMRQRYLVGRRTTRAATLGEGKKVLLWYYSCFRVVRDEHRLYLLVLESQKAYHPEEKTFGNVLFAGSHGATDIHQHVHSRIGVPLLMDVPHHIAQVGVAQVAHYWRPMRGVA